MRTQQSRPMRRQPRGRLGPALAALAVAGAVAATVGFVHVTNPDPEYQGGLAHPAAVVLLTGSVDHRMTPDPVYDGG